MSGRSGSPEDRPVRAEDLDVTLAVRRELGAERDQAVIGEFLDRVGAAIDERVDARVEARTRSGPAPGADQRPSTALAVVSVLSGIPITAIVLGVTHGSVAGCVVLVIVWLAIVGVNVAQAHRR
jgi:hypothetical protein